MRGLSSAFLFSGSSCHTLAHSSGVKSRPRALRLMSSSVAFFICVPLYTTLL